jgi:hypothetical protein
LDLLHQRLFRQRLVGSSLRAAKDVVRWYSSNASRRKRCPFTVRGLPPARHDAATRLGGLDQLRASRRHRPSAASQLRGFERFRVEVFAVLLPAIEQGLRRTSAPLPAV